MWVVAFSPSPLHHTLHRLTRALHSPLPSPDWTTRIVEVKGVNCVLQPEADAGCKSCSSPQSAVTTMLTASRSRPSLSRDTPRTGPRSRHCVSCAFTRKERCHLSVRSGHCRQEALRIEHRRSSHPSFATNPRSAETLDPLEQTTSTSAPSRLP